MLNWMNHSIRWIWVRRMPVNELRRSLLALKAGEHLFHVRELLFELILLPSNDLIKLRDFSLKIHVFLVDCLGLQRDGSVHRINKPCHAVVDDGSQPGRRLGEKRSDRLGVRGICRLELRRIKLSCALSPTVRPISASV